MRFKEYLNEGIHDGIKMGGEFFYIFKNPTPDEIADIKAEEIKKKADRDTINFVRSGIDEKGNLYSFSGNITHDDVKKRTGLKFIFHLESILNKKTTVMYMGDDIKKFITPDDLSFIADEVANFSEIYPIKINYQKSIKTAFPNSTYVTFREGGEATLLKSAFPDLNIKEKQGDEKYKQSLLTEKFKMGVKNHGSYYEIYKEPTSDEIAEIVRENKRKEKEGTGEIWAEAIPYVRFGYTEHGDLYAFSAELLHDDASKEILGSMSVGFCIKGLANYDTKNLMIWGDPDYLDSWGSKPTNPDWKRFKNTKNYIKDLKTAFPNYKHFAQRSSRDDNRSVDLIRDLWKEDMLTKNIV